MKKKWSSSEIEILLSSGGKVPKIEGRTAQAVKCKMHELGIFSSRNWTQEEIDELKSKVEKRGKIKIAGRTAASVSKKIYDLGLTERYREVRRKGKSNLKWSDEEIAMLKKGRIRIKGRSRCSVMDMRRRLGMKMKERPRPVYWTAEKEQLVRSLHLRGLSAREMVAAGHFPDRTSMAIQKKLCRMGLAKKMNIKRLPKKVHKEFLNFIKDSYLSETPKQIAERWNSENSKHKVNKGKVRKGMREMGVKLRFSMPKMVRRRLAAFIKECWHTKRDIKIKEKLSSISEAWNASNPEHLVSPKRIRIFASELVLIRKKMPDLAKLKLRKFLSENWEGRTTDELVEMWNSESLHKTNKLMVSRILQGLKLKITCSEMKRMQALRIREREIISAGAQSSKILEEKIRAERVKMMRARFSDNKDVFTGMQLQSEEVLAETM